MEKIKNCLSNYLIGGLIIVVYCMSPYIGDLVKYLSGYASISESMGIILSLLINTIQLALILMLFHKNLEKDWKDFRKNNSKYYSKYFKYYLIGLAVMYISNIILVFGFKNGIAGNEADIRSLLKTHPIYIYISAVLFAPLCEELVFRGAIKKIISNKILFIITSSLIFGGLHLVGNVNSFIDLLYIIPYSSLGLAFAYIYSKTDNIFITMGLHMMHNGILVGLQIAVMLFG